MFNFITMFNISVILVEKTIPSINCIDSIEGLFQFSYEIDKGGK